MSCIRQCDYNDCYEMENVYHIDYIVEAKLRELGENKHFKDSDVLDDICDDCINIINESYKEDCPLLVTDEYGNVKINKNYKKIGE